VLLVVLEANGRRNNIEFRGVVRIMYDTLTALEAVSNVFALFLFSLTKLEYYRYEIIIQAISMRISAIRCIRY
jgi:hypothetical protein